jgi:hypothetical protein
LGRLGATQFGQQVGAGEQNLGAPLPGRQPRLDNRERRLSLGVGSPIGHGSNLEMDRGPGGPGSRDRLYKEVLTVFRFGEAVIGGFAPAQPALI